MVQTEQQRVVLVNLIQCWRCKQYIPPGSEIRGRTLRTAVETGTGLNAGQLDRYEPVSLCVSCDEEAAVEQQAERERGHRVARFFGWVVGGLWMTGLFYTLGLPWPLAVLGTVLLIKLGILGHSIFAIMFTENVVEYFIGKAATLALAGPMTFTVLVLLVASKYVWKTVQRHGAASYVPVPSMSQ